MRRSFAAIALALAAGCSRDHSLLAADPPTGAGGGGGAAVTVGAGLVVSSASAGAGGAGGADAAAVTTGGGAGDAGGAPPVEPDGEPRLVLVHGLVDRPRIAVCLSTPAGAGAAVAPEPRGGVPFATSATVDRGALPEGEDDVVVFVVAGDEGLLEAATCSELLADPAASPALELVALGALSRSAIDAPRVLSMVAAGCVGGEGEESEVGAQACGTGFDPLSPTAMLVAAPLSRLVVEGRVGLQALGGSAAAAPFDVVARVGADGAPLLVAEEVSLGAALPLPPNTERDAVGLSAGGALEAAALLPGDDVELAVVDLEAAMVRAGIDGLEEGRSYALVFVGPTPTLGPGPFWPAFDAAIVAVGP